MSEERAQTGKAVGWQTFLVAACLLTLLIQGVQVWSSFNLHGWMPANLDFRFEPTRTPFVDRAVTPSRDRQIRRGDSIDFRLVSGSDRFRWKNWLVPGREYAVPVVRHGQAIRVPFVAERDKRSWPVYAVVAFWLAVAGNVWIVAFALLLSVRASRSVAARLLVSILLLELSWLGQAGTFVTQWIWLDSAMALFSAIGYGTCFALIAVYASTFATPIFRGRKVALWLAYASALVAIVLEAASELAPFGTVVDLSSQPPAVSWLIDVLPVVAAFVALGAALAATRGLERVRLIWATASLAILFVPTAIVSIVSVYVPAFSSTAGIVANVATLLTPVGLSYVLLNRRLLDIGFSLNRAAVFAVLSLIVFGTFNLAEWALGGWLSSLNRTANAGLSAALALALGLSLKPMHDGVERFVDRVLFRKRYDVERALRALTESAAHYSDPAALTRAVEETLRTQTEASSVTFLFDDRGRFGDLDPDDAALVALRTWNAVLDLHALRTAVAGDYAFPMIVKGRLTGALVVGPKPYREPYAPDELSAIERLATATGIALESLRSGRNGHSEDVYAMIVSLKADLVEVAGELHAQRDYLASLKDAVRPPIIALEPGGAPSAPSE